MEKRTNRQKVERSKNKRKMSVVRFLALVTTMVTKVDHGNLRSNDHGNHRSNLTMVVTTMVNTMVIHDFFIYCPVFCHI